jgi:hypothetical protein
MLLTKDFILPRIYNGITLANVALVTGSAQLTPQVNGISARLLDFTAENTSGASAWVQVFDAFAAPAGGTVPILSLKLLTLTQTTYHATDYNGFPVVNGIVIALSSTGPTYTSIGAASMSLTAFYIV